MQFDKWFKVRGSLTSFMSSSSSGGLQSMSVISPQLLIAAMAIPELLPSEDGGGWHCDSSLSFKCLQAARF